MSIQPALKRIVEGHETLSREEAAALLNGILRGADDLQFAALLAAMAIRGETPAEIAGFVDAVKGAATPVPVSVAERDLLVDTCGTGGDNSGTFNISTAAALVAAAAGATVAKHGNRAVTSQCGSADVLEALGIPVGLSPERGAASLRRHRFAFFHAPSLHPAMKAVMPVRRALGIRTIFHLAGPLSNPAGARAQVMGVPSPHLVPVVAEAMVLLGTRHAFVVHGGGLDELSISGPSSVAEVQDGRIALRTLSPTDLGLTLAPIESLRGGNAEENAAILRAIFAGERGSRRDIVILNAAAVLAAADRVHSIADGIPLAAHATDSGAVTALIAALATGE